MTPGGWERLARDRAARQRMNDAEGRRSDEPAAKRNGVSQAAEDFPCSSRRPECKVKLSVLPWRHR